MRSSHRWTAALAASLVLSLVAGLPATGEPLESIASLQGGVFDRVISVSASNMALGDAIRMVALKGDLNVMVADGLNTRVNLALNSVTLGDALRTLFAIGGLEAFSSGKVMVVIDRAKAMAKGLVAQNATVIPLHYASSQAVADFLNASDLARPYMAGGAGAKFAQADLRTNSVLVMAAPADIAVAERIVASLDRLQDRRVYRLNYANAVQVAEILNATLFNNGNKAPGGANLDVEGESTSDGSAQASSGASSAALTTSAGALRSTTLKNETIVVEPQEPEAVPDSRDNSVIVLGSREILSQADQLVAQLDRPQPQVAIEVKIMEVATKDASDLGLTFGGTIHSETAGFDPTSTALPGLSVVYDSTSALAQSLNAKLHALLSTNRAKLLAHPTVVASNNTESEID
ncbi:MAG: hypothetical protein KGR26_10085, partial [Cyanobacteria bacterium REEB65]|nr:hypothetical protein [Cyanobacteria bacterium REEB65]